MTKRSKKRRPLVAFQESVQYEAPNYAADAKRRGNVHRVAPRRGCDAHPYTILCGYRPSRNFFARPNYYFYRNDAAVCVLPDNLLDVEGAPFAKLPTLTTLEISDSNVRFRTIDGVLFDKTGEILYACPPGKSGVYKVPLGVKHVASDAFRNCSRLTEIRLPATVVTVAQAFQGCSSLKKIKTPPRVSWRDEDRTAHFVYYDAALPMNN